MKKFQVFSDSVNPSKGLRIYFINFFYLLPYNFMKKQTVSYQEIIITQLSIELLNWEGINQNFRPMQFKGRVYAG